MLVLCNEAVLCAQETRRVLHRGRHVRAKENAGARQAGLGDRTTHHQPAERNLDGTLRHVRYQCMRNFTQYLLLRTPRYGSVHTNRDRDR